MIIGPMEQFLHPSQQLARDLNSEHEKMALGICWHAIAELEGDYPTQEDLKKDFGLINHSHKRFVEFTWKKNVIVRIHAPEIVKDNFGYLKRTRKVEQIWKKKPGSV